MLRHDLYVYPSLTRGFLFHGHGLTRETGRDRKLGFFNDGYENHITYKSEMPVLFIGGIDDGMISGWMMRR